MEIHKENTKQDSICISADMAIPESDDSPTKFARVLWASGNEALAPKPCLNQESSRDQGFVGSTAAGQAIVIV